MTTNREVSATPSSEPAPTAMARREPIPPAERRRRQEATDSARANLGLSGFKISKEAEERTRRFVNGEIDMAEFVNVT